MSSPKKLESHTHKMKPLGSSKGSSNTIPHPKDYFLGPWAHLFCPRGKPCAEIIGPFEKWSCMHCGFVCNSKIHEKPPPSHSKANW